jgi:hypothetical protein
MASKDLKSLIKAAAQLGIKVTGLPATRTKFPKTKLGQLADELHDVREMRLALSKITDAVKAHEDAITNHLIDTVDMDVSGGVVGKRYKVLIKRETIPVVEDWDKVYDFIKKNDSFDLLNKALNRAAFKERAEQGVAVAGVGTFEAKKISLTKV